MKKPVWDMQNPRFELRMRNNPNPQKRTKKENNKENIASLRGIICLLAIIGVVGLKLSSAEYAGTALDKLEYILSKQTDFGTVAEDIIRGIDETVARFTGQTQQVNAEPVESLNFPLKTVSVTQDYEEQIHPVFQTVVDPVGVSLTAEKSDFVYAAAPGTVSGLSKNADGTYKMTLRLSKDLSVSYDGLAIVYFGESDEVRNKQIIGALPETNPVLTLSVWHNGEAADPKLYFAELNSK